MTAEFKSYLMVLCLPHSTIKYGLSSESQNSTNERRVTDMALLTQIKRGDENLSLRWGAWHLDCMVMAMLKDQTHYLARLIETNNKAVDELDTITAELKGKALSIETYKASENLINLLLRSNRELWDQATKWLFDFYPAEGYTLQNDHTFTDPADGEVLNLQAGDVLWFNIR